MKALTVRQPWAWAIMHGGKDIENRATLWKHRGPLAIHTSSTWERYAGSGWEDPRVYEQFVRLYGTEEEVTWRSAPRGFLLGTVELVDVHAASGGCCAPWGDALYNGRPTAHLVLKDPRPLSSPIPWRGALGLWDIPEEVLA